MSNGKYARVGRRVHLVQTDGPMYRGQPEVALCGTVLIRRELDAEALPACLECELRNVEWMRHEADRLVQLANEKALAIRRGQ